MGDGGPWARVADDQARRDWRCQRELGQLCRQLSEVGGWMVSCMVRQVKGNNGRGQAADPAAGSGRRRAVREDKEPRNCCWVTQSLPETRYPDNKASPI